MNNDVGIEDIEGSLASKYPWEAQYNHLQSDRTLSEYTIINMK